VRGETRQWGITLDSKILFQYPLTDRAG